MAWKGRFVWKSVILVQVVFYSVGSKLGIRGMKLCVGINSTKDVSTLSGSAIIVGIRVLIMPIRPGHVLETLLYSQLGFPALHVSDQLAA